MAGRAARGGARRRASAELPVQGPERLDRHAELPGDARELDGPGDLDDVELEDIARFEKELIPFLGKRYNDVLQDIEESKELRPPTEEA